jgi:hypothetical protein
VEPTALLCGALPSATVSGVPRVVTETSAASLVMARIVPRAAQGHNADSSALDHHVPTRAVECCAAPILPDRIVRRDAATTAVPLNAAASAAARVARARSVQPTANSKTVPNSAKVLSAAKTATDPPALRGASVTTAPSDAPVKSAAPTRPETALLQDALGSDVPLSAVVPTARLGAMVSSALPTAKQMGAQLDALATTVPVQGLRARRPHPQNPDVTPCRARRIARGWHVVPTAPPFGALQGATASDVLEGALETSAAMNALVQSVPTGAQEYCAAPARMGTTAQQDVSGTAVPLNALDSDVLLVATVPTARLGAMALNAQLTAKHMGVRPDARACTVTVQDLRAHRRIRRPQPRWFHTHLQQHRRLHRRLHLQARTSRAARL